METIKIFLASSLEELHRDRLEISAFIQQLNNQCVKHDRYIRLFMCEDEDIAMVQSRKQNEYNDSIRDSQLIILLFYHKVGEYTEEEFNVAYDHFKETGSPEIKVFFREDGAEPTDAVKAFRSTLENEKGVQYQTYSDIQSVKENILSWLQENPSLDFPLEF